MKRCIAAFTTLLVLVGGGHARAEFFGPGPHWVDTVPSGSYAFDSRATLGIDMDFDGVADFTSVFWGPTTVWSGGAVDAILGDPELGDIGTIDGHLDVVETELVSLEVGGSSPGGWVNVFAGDGIGDGLNSGPFNSPGAFIELADDNTLAYSFFYVDLDIVAPDMRLHTAEPVLLEATIDKVPPLLSLYLHPLAEPVDLLNENNIPVMQLINASHYPLPEPSTLVMLFVLGAIGIAVGCWRRTRKA